MVGPYSLQHEGGSEIDVKVTSVNILDGTVKLFHHAIQANIFVTVNIYQVFFLIQYEIKQ